MSSSVNIDGTWRNVAGKWVNIDGTWRQVVGTYVNIDGVWKNAGDALSFIINSMAGNQSAFTKNASGGYMEIKAGDSAAPSAGAITVDVKSTILIDATGYTNMKIDWDGSASSATNGHSNQAIFGSAVWDSNTMGQGNSIGFTSRGTISFSVAGLGKQTLIIRTGRHIDMVSNTPAFSDLKVYNIWLDNTLIWTGTKP